MSAVDVHSDAASCEVVLEKQDLQTAIDHGFASLSTTSPQMYQLG